MSGLVVRNPLAGNRRNRRCRIHPTNQMPQGRVSRRTLALPESAI
jgi:hypothetical protein